MTELALNLAWAIIAATSYALLFRRLRNRGAWRARGVSRVQCIVALTCFLAILFPVISLTDDLHEMQATAEEASPYRLIMKRAGLKDASTAGQAVTQFVFIVSTFAIGVGWAVLA